MTDVCNNPLDGLADRAKTDKGAPFEPDAVKAIQALVKSDPAEWQRLRAQLKAAGVRLADLDPKLSAQNTQQADENTPPSVVEDLEPWPEHVPGLELADIIHARITRHVNFASVADPTALTLWVMGSYCYDNFRLFPKCLISSPAKRCGKTTLCEVLEAFCSRSLMASNASTAAVFRTIEKYKPTFILDEADTFLRENKEVGGILNAGHTKRGAFVLRVVGDDHDPQRFSCWCPQVIAGIGAQSDTLTDRSIRINLQRQLPDEKRPAPDVELFERMTSIRRQLLRWADDRAVALKECDVVVPECGNDRARDNWGPLYAIAETLGGSWPDRVRSAYLVMERGDDGDVEDASLMMLEDVAAYFDSVSADGVPSQKLQEHLVGLVDRPWSEWGKGAFKISKHGVAGLLRSVGVRPGKIRIGDTTAQGYKRSKIEDAVRRYLPSTSLVPPTPLISTGTSEQMNDINNLHQHQDWNTDPNVPVDKPRNPLILNECSDVPVENGGSGTEVHETPDLGDLQGHSRHSEKLASIDSLDELEGFRNRQQFLPDEPPWTEEELAQINARETELRAEQENTQ